MTSTTDSRLILDPTLPILGLAAWSGTGKTTLLEQLLPALGHAGIRSAVIKHAHHSFDVDQPGKDSHRLRQAGATPMLVASRQRLALMLETPGEEDADLAMLVRMVMPLQPDLILVEGFKEWPLPKLELHRVGLGKSLLVEQDHWVQALACDEPDAMSVSVPVLDINDQAAMVDWVVRWVRDWPSKCRALNGECRP